MVESIKANEEFSKVPSYILADIIPAIAHYEAGKAKAHTSDEVLEALFDGLENLQTLETDGLDIFDSMFKNLENNLNK